MAKRYYNTIKKKEEREQIYPSVSVAVIIPVEVMTVML